MIIENLKLILNFKVPMRLYDLKKSMFLKIFLLNYKIYLCILFNLFNLANCKGTNIQLRRAKKNLKDNFSPFSFLFYFC